MFRKFPRLTAARAEESSRFKCALYVPRSQTQVRSRVRRVDWRRESVEWKRVKAKPGREVVMARSWAPVGEVDQEIPAGRLCQQASGQSLTRACRITSGDLTLHILPTLGIPFSLGLPLCGV